MDWTKTSVLVTGGSGFLGKALVRRLISLGVPSVKVLSRSVRAVDDTITSSAVSYVAGDIGEASTISNAFRNCDIVFHTAAKAGFWGSEESYYRPNVHGTLNVIDLCIKNSVHHLVFTSSPSVAYSPSVDIEGVDESIPYPLSYLAYYPSTKAMAEKAVMSVDQRVLKTVSLRPHLIWGPGDPHLLPRLIARAATGKLRIIGDGKNILDITYIDNVVESHIKAAEAIWSGSAACGKTYFISDNEPVNIWDWLNSLIADCGLPKIERHISYGNAYMAGALCEFLYHVLHLKGEPPMTRFVAGQLAHSHFFDISAAIRELKYAPVCSRPEAMDSTLSWLKKDVLPALRS